MHLVGLGVLLGTIFGLPAIALAAITTVDFNQAVVSTEAPLLELYDYQSAQSWTLSTPTDWSLGLFDDQTTQDLTDEFGNPFDQISLKPIGPTGVSPPKTDDLAWWDTNWNVRQCVVLDHTAPGATTVTEYQIRIPLDVSQLIAEGFLQADTGDLRALANDGITQLPLWVDPLLDAVWVQVDTIAAGQVQTVCLYFDHETGGQAPLAIHSEEAVFSYSTPKPIYYAVHDRYNEVVPVEVAAYLDNTQFDLDGVTQTTLNRNQLLTVDGVLPETVVSTTGPLSFRSPGNGFDTLVPISWAQTNFVVPSERLTGQRLSMYSPFGNATVNVFEGGGLAPNSTITIPSNTAVWIEAPGDLINNESIVVESDLPILLFHDVTTNRDAFPVVPFLDDEWFGVASTRGHYGASMNGTQIDEYRSDTTAELDWSLNRGDHVATARGGNQGGGSEAGVRLVLDTSAIPDPEISPVGAQFNAISQADSDGYESVSFFPAQELNSRYLLPTNSQYIAVSCPTPGTIIEITPALGPATTMTCQGVGTVGWAKDTQLIPVIPSTVDITGTVLGSATSVESPGGEPFYLYYENNASNGETNVLGLKQARQYTWPEPAMTERLEGLFPAEGLWLSPELAVPSGSGVFGQIDFLASLFPNTDVQIQIATDPAPAPTNFVGPDGTGATSFRPVDLPSALDFAHDGDAFLRARVKLVTTDRTVSPRLSRVTIGYNLPPLRRSLGSPSLITAVVGVSPDPNEVYLFRVKGPNPALTNATLGLWADTLSPTVADLNLRLENLANGIDAPQVGVPPSVGPQPFGPTSPYSVVGLITLNAPASSGSLDGRLQIDLDGSGILAETDYRVEVSTP